MLFSNWKMTITCAILITNFRRYSNSKSVSMEAYFVIKAIIKNEKKQLSGMGVVTVSCDM